MERIFILKYHVIYTTIDTTLQSKVYTEEDKTKVFASFSAADKFVRDYSLAKNNKQITNYKIEVYKVYE